MRSFLTRLRPFLYLALVICGPVLLLPNTMPFFVFLASVDAAACVLFALLMVGLHLCHSAAPERFRVEFADLAQKALGKTRCDKLHLILVRLANLASAVLLVATWHPVFGALMLVGHAAGTAFLRLMRKVSPTDA